MLPAFLIPLIGVIVVVLVAVYGFTSQGYFVHLGLLAAPVFIFLINNPGAWFVVIAGATRSQLVFPGLPQGLQVVHVLIAGFVAIRLAYAIIAKPRSEKLKLFEYALLAFTAVLFGTAMVRGFGIRGLGGSTWGGMSYIKLFISAGFLIAARQIVLKPRQIRAAVILMLVFSSIPFIAQLIFTLSGGAIYQQYAFVEAYVGGLLSSLEAAGSGGVVRYQMTGTLAASIVMFTLILIPPQGGRKILFTILILISFVLIGISGFRARIIWLIGTMVLFTYFNTHPKVRNSRIMFIGGAAVFALLACYPLIPYMPGAMQRSLSWLPFAPIPFDIKYEAEVSASTRLQVWEMAWNEVPKYLLIGKGFTVNPAEIMSLSVQRDWALRAFAGHNYHSGPLSLLLDTGVFGFLTGSLFLIASGWEMFRRHAHIAGPPLIKRAYTFFLVSHLYSIPSYYLIFGDVRETFPTMMINLAFMMVLYNSSTLTQNVPAATAPAVVPARPHGRTAPALAMRRPLSGGPARRPT